MGIRSRRLLRLVGPDGERVVEPYVHGFDPKGAESLLCFQVQGVSKSGRQVGWKTLRLGKVTTIVTLEVVTLPQRDEYAGYGRGLTDVHCRVRHD